VLPLLLVSFVATYERLGWTKTWLKNIFLGGFIAICIFTAYCILVLDRCYNMYFPDFPDGFWFNMNPNIGRRLVLVCTCGTLLAYAWRRMSQAVFLCAFGLISLVGNYYMSLYVIQRVPLRIALLLFSKRSSAEMGSMPVQFSIPSQGAEKPTGCCSIFRPRTTLS
jgi:hypothetical protein